MFDCPPRMNISFRDSNPFIRAVGSEMDGWEMAMIKRRRERTRDIDLIPSLCLCFFLSLSHTERSEVVTLGGNLGGRKGILLGKSGGKVTIINAIGDLFSLLIISRSYDSYRCIPTVYFWSDGEFVNSWGDQHRKMWNKRFRFHQIFALILNYKEMIRTRNVGRTTRLGFCNFSFFNNFFLLFWGHKTKDGPRLLLRE